MAADDARTWRRWIGTDARSHPEPRASWPAYAWALVAVAVCTGVNQLLFGKVIEENLILVYLLGLLPVALRGVRGAAIVAAVLAVLAFNYFFTAPTFSLRVYDPRYLFSFLVMGGVGILVSSLTARLADEVRSLQRAEADLRHYAQQLRQANRELKDADRYKDEFLAAVSHELRTPLSTVIGFGSLLAEGDAGSLTAEQQAYLSPMLKGAKELDAMVKDLLELSRIQAGKLVLACSVTEYAPVVHASLEDLLPVAEEKGVRLAVEVQVVGEVVLDGDRLMEVVHHLVENAIKFTPAGGRITVEAHAEGDWVVTEVRDTGCGIPAETLSRLFKPFRQADMSSTRPAGGLGMGLAISKAIVEAHGGRIGVLSEPGQGSRFWFTLPRVPRGGGCAGSLTDLVSGSEAPPRGPGEPRRA